ncbi:MAG: MFS transporter [Desulfobacteraceae bacterium]|nr:MFS transporter [Desulfobacteraceae bacterium]
MPKAARLLNVNFVLLWQGQIVSLAGTSLSRIALTLWIAEATGSPTLMGTIMMVASLPGLVMVPLGGVFADRCSRKNVLVCCDLVNGGLAVLLGAAIYAAAESLKLAIAAVLLASLGMSVADSLFVPAVNAFIPDLVPSEKLLAANAFSNTSIQVAGLAGKVAGGALYRLLGAPLILLADGITFLASAISESFIREPRSPKEKSVPPTPKNFLAEAKEGLAYIWARPGLWAAVLVSAGLHFFLEPLFVLLPFYVRDPRYLGASADWYGYILAGFGIGTLTGFWLASLLAKGAQGRRTVPLVIGSQAAAGVGIALMGYLLHPVAILALMTGIGFLFGMAGNFLSTVLQTGVPNEVRGRVLAVATTLAMSLAPLAMGLGGVMADRLGRIDLILAGCGLALAGGAPATATMGSYRRFLAGEERDEAEESQPAAAVPG